MVAWGIPVNATSAGAQAESYVRARSVIRAFEVCVQIGSRQNAVIGKFPPELIRMIGKIVEENILYSSTSPFPEGVWDTWDRQVRCIQGECRPSDHLCDDRLLDYFDDVRDCPTCSEFLGFDEDWDDECDMLDLDVFDEWCSHGDFDPCELHSGQTEFLRDIGLEKPPRSGRTKEILLSKLNKILLLDFGLQLYFSMHARQNHAFPPNYEVYAYLILPSRHTAGHNESNEAGSSYMATMFLNPSDIVPYTPELKQKFDFAMTRLGLKPDLDYLQDHASQPTTETHYQKEKGDSKGQEEGLCPFHAHNLSKDKTSLELSEWPKLTVVSHAVSSSRCFSNPADLLGFPG